jgi:hypothetical protein
MQWQDASEIVIGLILDNRLSLNAVRPDLFFPPYSDIIKLMKDGTATTEELIQKVGLSPVSASIDAARNVNGLGDTNWVSILEDSVLTYQAGQKLERMSRKLQQGEAVDWSQISSIAHKAQEGIGGDFVPLSDIEARKIPFIKTGFTAIDKHLGGIPAVGQIIVAAAPSAGKTTFMANLASCFAKTHLDKTVCIFTLEMVATEFKMRFREMNKLDETVEKRILVNDTPMTPEEIINKSATIDNLGMIAIDFADLMIRGDTTESSMAHIYRVFMLGAKTLNCPVILLSQLNRKYGGGIPRPTHIRYTGLAEALAWMILMLYNPSQDYFSSEEDRKGEDALPIRDNRAYIVAWKIRGGFREHEEESPGAIDLPFRGKYGWSTKNPGKWFSLKKL